MASPEAELYRTQLAINPEDAHKTAEQQRAEWESIMENIDLPPNTHIESLEIAGLHCEKITLGEMIPNHIMLYLHGGGYVSGSCLTHRYMASQLSSVLKMPILLVDYRLAPENPFPAGVEDAIAVYEALLPKGEAIFMGGDSAGGGLVMSTLLAIKEKKLPMPRGAVLMSPWVDLTLTGESLETRLAVEPVVDRVGLEICVQQYIGNADPKNPNISSIFADLSGLPPLCIQAGDHELLLSDAERLAEAARSAGVKVELRVWPEMWHVFQALAPDLTEASEALQHMADFMKKYELLG